MSYDTKHAVIQKVFLKFLACVRCYFRGLGSTQTRIPVHLDLSFQQEETDREVNHNK